MDQQEIERGILFDPVHLWSIIQQKQEAWSIKQYFIAHARANYNLGSRARTRGWSIEIAPQEDCVAFFFIKAIVLLKLDQLSYGGEGYYTAVEFS